ncbi:hypothetical protein [Salinicola lusitanus]|uniref:hypothetical protein n=1 Tax=Salinicola lusitanus TaxID=1949085 RepID=UPI000DA19CF5|nr:hypothetical protein [Salinicola lusitanus]
MTTTTTYTNQFAPAIAGVCVLEDSSAALFRKSRGELFDGCMRHAGLYQKANRSIEGGMHKAIAADYAAAQIAVGEVDRILNSLGGNS